jgi:hypothetical protein
LAAAGWYRSVHGFGSGTFFCGLDFFDGCPEVRLFGEGVLPHALNLVEAHWDITAIAAFFGFSNRMAGVMDMRPNEEFYFLGHERPARKPNGA